MLRFIVGFATASLMLATVAVAEQAARKPVGTKPPARAAAASPAAGKVVWQHKCITFIVPGTRMENEIAELAQEGWQMAGLANTPSVHAGTGSLIGCFKRQARLR